MDSSLQEIPLRLGKFEISRELGRGSMAVVYLGHDPFMNRQVAIKVALPKYIRDKNTANVFRKMFFNEARIAGMLDNRFILPVYDAGIEKDFLFIVMEYIGNGSTLKPYCSKENLLPVPKVIELVYKCCRGLDYAHSRDVVHRDIKPSNILLTEEMDVRIADFGIAQIMHGEETQVLKLMGTPYYMSPEQVSEQELTHQTDIFSLGVLLYELLTGVLPFNATTFAALTHQILNREPALMRQIRPEVPEILEMIVKRALAKKPENRYPRCSDFASDLLLAFRNESHAAVTGDRTKQEKLRKLKQNRFFSDFFDSELWEIIEACEWSEYGPNDTIITEGDLDDSFYVIVQGSVTVMKGERLLAQLHDGDCLGEMAFLSKDRRTASIFADGEVMLLKLNGTDLEKTSAHCQLRFMRVFISTLVNRLSQTTERLSRFQSDSD